MMVFAHEPWFDEAQIWLLARDASPWTLLVKYLRYDNTPGLWHFLLVAPAKLKLPYISMNILAAAIAIAAMYVFLRYSRFPTIVKILFPFTFFVFFQYAVVARNLVLLPLLLFLIASIYKQRMNQVFLYLLLLCLLANVSLHGYLIAIGLVFVDVVDFFKHRSAVEKPVKRRQFISFLIFLVVCLAILLLVWPPKDSVWVANRTGLIGTTLNHFLGMNGQMLNGAFTDLTYITIPVLFVSILWFRRKRVLLLYLATTLPLLVLFGVTWGAPWHAGILLLVWLFAMWISFQDREKYYLPDERYPRALRTMAIAAMVIVFLFQIGWSYQTYRYDLLKPYSGSRAAADYIKKNHLEDKVIYSTRVFSCAILPYFNSNIFNNLNGKKNPSFAPWKLKELRPTNCWKDLVDIVKDQPDIIIVSGVSPNAKKLLSTSRSNYRQVAFFDGAVFCKYKRIRDDSFAFYERVGPPVEPEH